MDEDNGKIKEKLVKGGGLIDKLGGPDISQEIINPHSLPGST